MILRYNPTPTSCLRSTVCVFHTNGRINTSPVAGRWVALTDSMPQERGTLLSSSHPRWRTNSTRVKDLAWAKETSSGLPGVREKRRKEKKIPTTGSRHFSAVHFALAQDKKLPRQRPIESLWSHYRCNTLTSYRKNLPLRGVCMSSIARH